MYHDFNGILMCMINEIPLREKINSAVNALWGKTKNSSFLGMNNERNDPLSAVNIELARIKERGPDAWAINRIIEADPQKGLPRIQAENIMHLQGMTDLPEQNVTTHAVVSTAFIMAQNAGTPDPLVYKVKQSWLAQSIMDLDTSPAAKGLLCVMQYLPEFKDNVSLIQMHYQWNCIANHFINNLDEHVLRTQVDTWCSKHFNMPPTQNNTLVTGIAIKSIHGMLNEEHRVQLEEDQMHIIMSLALLNGFCNTDADFDAAMKDVSPTAAINNEYTK